MYHKRRSINIILIIYFIKVVFPTIERGPDHVGKLAGEDVEFICVTQTKECTNIDWQKQEGQQTPKYIYSSERGMVNRDTFSVNRYSFMSKDCTLKIANLSVSDSGKFICTEVIGEKPQSESAVLVVANPIKSCELSPRRDTFLDGTKVTLMSDVDLPPEHLVSTNLNISFVSSSGVVVANASGHGRLAVSYEETVQPRILQSYSCSLTFTPSPQAQARPVVKEICRTDEKFVDFCVTNIRFNPAKDIFNPDEHVTCEADGHPKVDYTWRWLNRTNEKWVTNAIIIDKEAVDGDVYTCTANNTVNGQPCTAMKMAHVTTSVQGSSTGLIIGVVLCVLILIILVVVVIYYLYRKNGQFGFRDEEKQRGDKEAGKPLTVPNTGPQKPQQAGHLPMTEANTATSGRPAENPPKPPRMSQAK